MVSPEVGHNLRRQGAAQRGNVVLLLALQQTIQAVVGIGKVGHCCALLLVCCSPCTSRGLKT